jgi:hypothetical protein
MLTSSSATTTCSSSTPAVTTDGGTRAPLPQRGVELGKLPRVAVVNPPLHVVHLLHKRPAQ